VWSPSSIASSIGREGRLEGVRTSTTLVVDDFFDSLQNWTNRERHNMRQREGKRLGEERGDRAHRRRWNRTEMLAETSDSDEESFRAGDVLGGE
jgi:hypothetical protein